MHGHCLHEFVWPRRASDGHYYQHCLLCGAKYEYNWNSMQRIESMDAKPKRTSSSQRLSNWSAHSKAAPRLKLLVELEPAHRVFFQNLIELVFRSTSPIAKTSMAIPFWSDVFVSSRVPWSRLLESMFGHVIVVAVVLILFQGWKYQEPPQRSIFRKSYVSYYMPSQSFPALRASQSPVRARPKRRFRPIDQPMHRVLPERTQRVIRPPDIKLGDFVPPKIVTSNPVAGVIPPSAIRRSQLIAPAGPAWVVPPPVNIDQATSRHAGLPQASIIAPPAYAKAVSSRLAMAPLGAVVIAPPPAFEGSIGKIENMNVRRPAVVEPSPRLPTPLQRAISGMDQVATLGSPATAVVPPPPAVRGSGTLVDGRATPLAGTGLQAVPPPSSLQNAGNSVAGERPIAMGTHAPVAPAATPVVEDSHGAITEELPIRLLGLALALPNSSYFSNYEVFIAERRISKVASQLIKLVYVSLPYQRRLSEYGLNKSRVFKLRVRRDRTCDESLLQMTWPETDPHPGSQYSSDSPGLSAGDRNEVLPCYCTTADDYRRAVSRGR